MNENSKFKEEWNMYCAEKKTNFHIQSERDSQCTYILLSVYTLSPYPFKASGLVHDVFFLYRRNLDIIKYTKLTTLFTLLVLHSPEKNSQLRHWLINWGKGCKRNLFLSSVKIRLYFCRSYTWPSWLVYHLSV